MTDREFFEAVIASGISADIVAEAQGRLDKLNARNAAKADERNRKNGATIAAIMTALGEHPEGIISTDLATITGESVNRVIGLCNVLVTEGKLKKDNALDSEGKSKKRYCLVTD